MQNGLYACLMWLVTQIDDRCRTFAGAARVRCGAVLLCPILNPNPPPKPIATRSQSMHKFVAFIYLLLLFMQRRKLRCMNDNNIGHSSARITGHQFCTHSPFHTKIGIRCRFAHQFFCFSCLTSRSLTFQWDAPLTGPSACELVMLRARFILIRNAQAMLLLAGKSFFFLIILIETKTRNGECTWWRR